MLPVRYGYPSPAMWQAQERGEILLGGCTVGPGMADFRCPDCFDPWFPDAPEADDTIVTGPGAPQVVCARCRHRISPGQRAVVRRLPDGAKVFDHRDGCVSEDADV